MKITSYAVEKLKDPFGILTGDRYEFFLDIEVPDDDELFTENGLYLKVLYVVEGPISRIASYHLHENTTQNYLDFELEDEELAMIEAFCKDHISE